MGNTALGNEALGNGNAHFGVHEKNNFCSQRGCIEISNSEHIYTMQEAIERDQWQALFDKYDAFQEHDIPCWSDDSDRITEIDEMPR